MPAIHDTVRQKLRFAERRLADLVGLVRAGTMPSDVDGRQQAVQEFFFHLSGAMDFMAQVVNSEQALGIADDDVSIGRVCVKLRASTASATLVAAMEGLNIKVHKTPLPPDPYSDDGLMFRVVNYRNEVVHRDANPFNFVISSTGKTAYLTLDPRHRPAVPHVASRVPIVADLHSMIEVVTQRCDEVFKAL